MGQASGTAAQAFVLLARPFVIGFSVGFSACGRVFFEVQPIDATGPSDASEASDDDGRMVDRPPEQDVADQRPESQDGPRLLDGENVTAPPGWTVEVYRDFSADYEFRSMDFSEPMETYSNDTIRLFVVEAPFEPGLGIVAGRHVLELQASGAFVDHNYTPAAVDTVGPDVITAGTFFPNIDGAPAIVLSATSWGAGDGHYTLDTSWTLTQATANNNVWTVSADPTGRFDGLGLPALYWSGYEQALFRYGWVEIVPAASASDIQVLPGGEMLAVVQGAPASLVRIESVTHGVTQLMGPAMRSLTLVAGAPERFSGYAYALYDQRQLIELRRDGSFTVLAETDWTWASAVVPPASHPLGAGRPGFYILDKNRALDRDRVIRLVPP